MTAVVIANPGEDGVLQFVQRPVPQPGPGEILVKVAAVGVNRVDVLQRRGRYTPPDGTTDIIGVEISGEVVALGLGPSRFSVGDKVCGIVVGGAYADYVAVPEGQALPIPAGLSMVQAAAVPEAVFTLWSALYDQGRLSPGESLLIHGGASGIGTTAIMMAKALGAGKVFATAGSDDKCAACTRLGADRAINYRTEDFVQVVRDEMGGPGVDVILDMVAGDYVQRNIDLLEPDGRMVLIGTMQGTRVAQFDPVDIMFRRLAITGVSLRGQGVLRKTRIAEQIERKVWPLVRDGRLAPVVDKVLGMSEAKEAHRRLEATEHTGKIILETGR